VTGIDDDADAIQSARENAALNPAARVAFELVDLRVAHVAPADVVLANLTGALLSSAASMLQSLTAPGGTLILSGLMEHEEPEVRASFESLQVVRRDQEDEWLCLVLQKP
jgi:ribosomal protein L11 methyltransferase